MPDIVIDVKIEEGMRSREQSHQMMRSKMRKRKDRRKFQRGEYVLWREPTGANKGKWMRNMEILEAKPHEKSYYMKDLSTNSIYLRNKDQLKLKEGYQSLTVAEATTVSLSQT